MFLNNLIEFIKINMVLIRNGTELTDIIIRFSVCSKITGFPDRLCVPHVSTIFGSRGSDRSVQPFGIPCHSQLRRAPPSIRSRNNLRCICLPQPYLLVELSSMRLRFDDLHLFINLVALDFVHVQMYVMFMENGLD